MKDRLIADDRIEIIYGQNLLPIHRLRRHPGIRLPRLPLDHAVEISERSVEHRRSLCRQRHPKQRDYKKGEHVSVNLFHEYYGVLNSIPMIGARI